MPNPALLGISLLSQLYAHLLIYRQIPPLMRASLMAQMVKRLPTMWETRF